MTFAGFVLCLVVLGVILIVGSAAEAKDKKREKELQEYIKKRDEEREKERLAKMTPEGRTHKENPLKCLNYLYFKPLDNDPSIICVRCSECNTTRGFLNKSLETGKLEITRTACWLDYFTDPHEACKPHPEIDGALREVLLKHYPDADVPDYEYVRTEMAKLQAEAAFRAARQDSVPKCPNCNSRNIQPISNTKRVASTAVMGIASSTIGKSYECKDCKYKW